MAFRTAYNFGVSKGWKSTMASKAVQSAKEECDINTIVRRFGLSGQLPVGVRQPTYGDFAGVTNYHEALNAIVMAKESFEELPAEIRIQFDNDAGKFVDFCSDPRNQKQAEEWGMVMPEKLVSAAGDLAAGGVPDTTGVVNVQPSTGTT